MNKISKILKFRKIEFRLEMKFVTVTSSLNYFDS